MDVTTITIILAILAIVVTIVFGVVTIYQSRSYFNLKNQFEGIKDKYDTQTGVINNNIGNIKEICETIKMQLDDSIGKQIQSRFLALVDKAFDGEIGNVQNLEQIVSNALEKNDGSNKNIVQLIGKQHTDIEFIKITLHSVMTLNSAISYQIIGNVEDIVEEKNVEKYLEEKVVSLCKNNPIVFLRDILRNTSANIPCQKKLEIIEKLKNNGVVVFNSSELCESTVISLSVELENP